MQNRIHCHALDAHSYCANTPRSASQINKTALGLIMEIAANKTQGVSAFFRSERITPRGVHVGFVCDLETPYMAKVSTYVWARMSRGIESGKLMKAIFNGVS